MRTEVSHAFTKRKGRAPGGSVEVYAWLLMRLTGVALLALAVFHLFWMHMVIGVENIDFSVVAGRWQNPFWRLYDLLLLAFALTHGMTGLRTIIDDYVHAPGWRVTVKSALLMVYVLFLGMGAYIIVAFETPATMAVTP